MRQILMFIFKLWDGLIDKNKYVQEEETTDSKDDICPSPWLPLFPI
jgi:hypothetical protein